MLVSEAKAGQVIGEVLLAHKVIMGYPLQYQCLIIRCVNSNIHCLFK